MIAFGWQATKDVIETSTGLAQDALHVYAAVLIQLTVAAVSRRGLRSPVPWLAVLVLALFNEWSDITEDHLFEKWERAEALHDLWNTMIMPTVLLLLARYAPGLITRQSARR